MSNADKTREKLLNSMRKTKAGSEQKEDNAGSSAQKESEKPASAPAASSSKPAKQSPVPAKKKSSKTPVMQGSSDPYQSRGRVWPD